MNLGKVIDIAVFVAGLDEEYQNNIIVGINEFARKNNINVSYFSAFGGMIDSKLFDIGEYAIYKLANLKKFDAAILMTNTINDDSVKESIINRIKASGIPAVVFDCDDFPEFHNISINNTRAMRDMVRHVITEHGAKVINYISGPMSNPEAVERLLAFRDVMAENGLTVEENRIYYGEFRRYDGHDAIEEYMKSGLPLPDAFICANDAMALTAISTLEKYGFCIPLDVIVTGFDHTFSARNYCPALTTVSRPLSKLGSLACNVILDLLNGKEPKYNELEASCVFTESCGCGSLAPDNFSEFRKTMYNKNEYANDNVHKLNILAAKLAETENATELFGVIQNFVEELDCERFSLCLTSNWQEAFADVDSDLYESMTSPFVWDKGELNSVEYFRGSNMFPIPQESSGNINYFLPLHFRNKTLGYYIITNGDFPINLLCHTFSMNISHSIENLRKLTHINKAMEELNKVYVIDPLCDIYNRNGFIKFSDEIFKSSVSENKKIMLTFIDMDGLKYINDNYGHDEGDFAIRQLAFVIKECCRPGVICARFGGDEFVIFDPSATDDSSDLLEKRFSAKLASINSIINKPYSISASLGSYVTTVGSGDTLYKIVKQADELMYEVKKQKKNSRTGRDGK